MRNELMSDVTRGDSDSLVQQAFVQKYGPTVLAAPTTPASIAPRGSCPSRAHPWIRPRHLRGSRLEESPYAALADGLRPLRGAELEQFRDQARKETDL